jgi:hypothetical protein
MGKSDGKKYTIMIRPYFDKDIEPVPCTFENFFNILWDESCHLLGDIFNILMQGMSDYYKAKQEERDKDQKSNFIRGN